MRSAVGTLVRGVRNAATVAPISFGGGTRSGFFGQQTGGSQGMDALLGTTAGVGTLFSIVNLTSNAVAQVKWKLWRIPANYSGDPAERVEVTKHLALDVLKKPNPFMTTQELVEAGQQHIDLTGEGWCVFGKSAFGWPESIWPVRPDKMAPVPSATEYIAGYVYTGPDGEKVPLGITDVGMIRMPNPLDPYRGLGPVQALLTTIDSEKYSMAWNRNFFINSAEPGGVIQVPDNWEDEDFNTFQARWREMHRGVSNAHRIALLEGGAQWVANSMNHRDMQFVELRTVSRDTMLEAFHMAGSMLGVSEHVNKANAQVGEISFGRWLLVQRLERWKQMWNNDFLPLFGPTTANLELDYESPVPTDSADENAALLAKSQAAVALVGAGWDDVDVLATCELPPMKFERPVTPPPVHIIPGGPLDPTKPPVDPNTNPAEDDKQPADDAKEMANA